MKAINLLKAGETAVAVFTRSDQFRVDEKGDGKTGNWKAKPGQMFDRAIMYHRVVEKSPNGAEHQFAETGTNPVKYFR